MKVKILLDAELVRTGERAPNMEGGFANSRHRNQRSLMWVEWKKWERKEVGWGETKLREGHTQGNGGSIRMRVGVAMYTLPRHKRSQVEMAPCLSLCKILWLQWDGWNGKDRRSKKTKMLSSFDACWRKESHFSSRAMTLGGFPGSWGWPYTYAHMGSSIWTWWDVLNKYQVGEDTVGPRQIRSRWLRGRYTPNTLYIWLKFSKNESIFLKFYPPPFLVIRFLWEGVESVLDTSIPLLLPRPVPLKWWALAEKEGCHT